MKILGYEYDVRVTDRDSVQGAGYQTARTQSIRISADLCAEQQQSTLIHEVIEAVNYHLELKLEHPQIMGLETGIYGMLRDAGVDMAALLERSIRH